MPHAYVSVTFLKGTGALNVDGTPYDTRLRQLAESVAYEIDRYCNRTFQPYDATFDFPGDGGTILTIRDLIAIGTLKEDDGNDGSFDTNWAAADYILHPLNAQPTDEWGRPYTTIMVSPKSDGSQDVFLAGPNRYRIDGTWGYMGVTRDSGAQTSGTTGTGTTIPLNTVGVEPGMMILVGSGAVRERIYVQSTATNTLTVRRGQYGSTSSNHATTLTVNYFVYPPPIVEAAFIQTARLWTRRNSGFATQLGIPETGVIQTFAGGLDHDVKMLLNPYRRLK